MREATHERIAHGRAYGSGRVEFGLAQRELDTAGSLVGEGREPADPARRETRQVLVGCERHAHALGALGENASGKLRGDLIERHLGALARGTDLEFAVAALDGALAKDQLVGEAHKVGIGKLDAGALLTIVDDDLEALGGKLLGDLLGGGPHELVVDVERNDGDFVGSHGDGPADAVLVIVLLDDGGQRARDAHAVAAHDERLLLAVLVHEGGAHGLGVLRAQLEDLRDLDAAGGREGLAAVRAGVAGDDGHEVGPGVGRKVAALLDAGEVEALLVGAAEPLVSLLEAFVADHADALGQVDRTDEALAQAKLDELVFVHEVVLAKGVLGLDVVELVVAGNEDERRGALPIDEAQGLDGGLRGNAKEGRDLIDGAAAGRGDLGEAAVAWAVDDGDGGRGGLVVGREAAVVAVDEAGLARVGEGHVLDGGVAADLAAVGDDGKGLEAAAHADVGVGGLHLVVLLLQALLRGGEAVGVLHDELAATHEAVAGTELVAEFVLDVVEVDRQLLVAAQLVAHEGRDGLLVGGAQDELALVAVVEADELLAIGVDAAALAPEVGVDHDRHHELLGAGGVHLVADDILDLADGAPGERQVGVEARGLLADHAGAKQQAVARELGLRRVLLERGGVEAAHHHGLHVVPSSGASTYTNYYNLCR